MLLMNQVCSLWFSFDNLAILFIFPFIWFYRKILRFRRIDKWVLLDVCRASSLKSEKMTPFERTVFCQREIRPKSALLFKSSLLLLICFCLPLLCLTLHNCMHLIQLTMIGWSGTLTVINSSFFSSLLVFAPIGYVFSLFIAVAHWFLSALLALEVYLLLGTHSLTLPIRLAQPTQLSIPEIIRHFRTILVDLGPKSDVFGLECVNRWVEREWVYKVIWGDEGGWGCRRHFVGEAAGVLGSHGVQVGRHQSFYWVLFGLGTLSAAFPRAGRPSNQFSHKFIRLQPRVLGISVPLRTLLACIFWRLQLILIRFRAEELAYLVRGGGLCEWSRKRVNNIWSTSSQPKPYCSSLQSDGILITCVHLLATLNILYRILERDVIWPRLFVILLCQFLCQLFKAGVNFIDVVEAVRVLDRWVIAQPRICLRIIEVIKNLILLVVVVFIHNWNVLLCLLLPQSWELVLIFIEIGIIVNKRLLDCRKWFWNWS